MENRIEESVLVQRFMETCNALGCPVEVLGSEASAYGVSLDVKPVAGVRIIDFLKIRDDIGLRLGVYYIQIILPGNGSWKLTVNILMEKPAGRSIGECAAVADKAVGGPNLCLGHGITGRTVTLDLDKHPGVLVAGVVRNDVSDFIRTMEAEIAASTALTGIEVIHAEGEMAYGVLTDFCHRMAKGDSIRRSVVFIDRYEDLIRAKGYEAEDLICRLLSMRKTDALHFVIGTSCPTVDVVSGMIVNSVSAKIAFRVDDIVQSRTIIRTAGAECLAGAGEGLLVSSDMKNSEWFAVPDVSL